MAEQRRPRVDLAGGRDARKRRHARPRDRGLRLRRRAASTDGEPSLTPGESSERAAAPVLLAPPVEEAAPEHQPAPPPVDLTAPPTRDEVPEPSDREGREAEVVDEPGHVATIRGLRPLSAWSRVVAALVLTLLAMAIVAAAVMWYLVPDLADDLSARGAQLVSWLWSSIPGR